MRRIIALLAALFSAEGMALEACDLQHKKIKGFKPERCLENRLCWQLPYENKCVLSQKSSNFSEEFNSSDPIIGNMIKFRNLFYSELSSKNKKNAHNIILLPPKQLLEYPESGSESEFRDILRQYSPNFLAKLSKKYGFKDIERSTQKAKISVFFFRGSPSEFNTSEPFGDFDWSNSSLYKRWKAKMRSLPHEAKLVKAYSHEHAAIKDFNIESLVDVYSVDDKNGEAIINIVSFRTDIATFESSEINEVVIPMFIERITLIDSLVDLPNLYLMSHSMGTMRTLEISSRLHNDANPPAWFSKLKGLISLSGAIWGSSSGQVSAIDGEGFNILQKNLIKILATKEDRIRNDQQQVLYEILGYVYEMGLGYNKTYESVAVEGIKMNYPMTPEALRLIKAVRSGLKYGLPINFTPSSQKTFSLADKGGLKDILKVLNLKEHLNDGTVILKIQRIMRNFKNKIEDTREKNRMLWFENHSLPTSIRYVSLASTMPDPFSYLVAEYEEDSLELNGFFDKESADYQIQKSSQYDAFYNDKIRLADGSTSYHHNIFHPRKHLALNPKQKKYEVENIALFASDHLGMIIGKAFQGEKDSFNHFPRMSMLRALARYLEED